MARRLLCAIRMLRIRRPVTGAEFRLLALSLFGAVVSGCAAFAMISSGQGIAHLCMAFGLGVIAWRYCRSLGRSVGRLKEARNLQAAMRDTGRVLERLRGYELLRRLVGTPGKQEHVVVGPNGVFVVTTRRTGERRGASREPGAFLAGRKTRDDLVEEAKMEAACVAERIFRRLGFRPKVKPVLCFPHGLVAVGENRRGVMVVTAPNVARAIRAEPADTLLSPPEVEAIVAALAEPVPAAARPVPAFLRLMPRPQPRG